MNWGEMSDLDINKKLTQLVKGYSDSFMIRNSGVYFYYCNNWSDMGPLIVGHGISIIRLKNTTLSVACTDVEFENICLSPDGSDNGFSAFYAKNEVYHVNPLRAAAICLIKKLEAENV